jgi:hypothetical protein
MLWIQKLESRFPFPRVNATHLELRIDQSLSRIVRLARAWFAVCPEVTLERQSFRASPVPLEAIIDVEPGVMDDRPFGLLELDEAGLEAFLHVARDQVWVELALPKEEVFESRPVALDDFPLLPSPTIEPDAEAMVQVTLALEVLLGHSGQVVEEALERLIGQLDFALEQSDFDGATNWQPKNSGFKLLDWRREGSS